MRRSKSSLLLESKTFQHQLSYRARKRDNELFRRCVRCPKTVEDGYLCCQACRARMAQQKQEALERGMCLDCWTVPALPGKRFCATHAAQRQQSDSSRYTQRLIRRRCVKCKPRQSLLYEFGELSRPYPL
jgi:hypothetical protein